MFYSKSKNGFFHPDFHGENIPSDAVEIPHELYQALLDGQSKGKAIDCDVYGNPVLRDTVLLPVEAPRSVTMRQARLALLATNQLDDATEIIRTAGRGAQIEWEFAATVERDNPLVLQLGESLDIDLDALFTVAAQL